MSVVRTTALDVLVDGGSSHGDLVFVDDKLVAVLVIVTREELGDEGLDSGWFLEAGFGPCSPLKIANPGVFSDEQSALRWIGQQVERAG